MPSTPSRTKGKIPISSNDVDSAQDFTAPQLQILDQSLRCPVCLSHFLAPLMLTSCTHTFCSTCVRSYLSLHAKCPSCLEPADSSKLRKVSVIENAVAAWQEARSFFIKQEAKWKRNSSSVSTSNQPEQKQHEIEDSDTDIKIISEESNKNKQAANWTALFNASSPTKAKGEEKPLKRMHMPADYNMRSKKEMIKLLKEHDIPCDTKESTSSLIARHRQFVVFNNSNLDLPSPKPHSHVLRQLQQWWQLQKRKPENTDLKEHEKSNREAFAQLIAEARSSMHEKKHISSTSSTPAPAMKEESVTEDCPPSPSLNDNHDQKEPADLLLSDSDNNEFDDSINYQNMAEVENIVLSSKRPNNIISSSMDSDSDTVGGEQQKRRRLLNNENNNRDSTADNELFQHPPPRPPHRTPSPFDPNGPPLSQIRRIPIT